MFTEKYSKRAVLVGGSNCFGKWKNRQLLLEDGMNTSPGWGCTVAVPFVTSLRAGNIAGKAQALYELGSKEKKEAKVPKKKI